MLAIINLSVLYCFMNSVLLLVVLRTQNFGDQMHPMIISLIKHATNLISIEFYSGPNTSSQVKIGQ